jgi:hypothetical protein
MAEKTRQGTLFDNERVRFFLRRLTERSLTDFRKMLNVTVQQYGEHWQAMWQQTLPRIKSWPIAAIASISKEFERDVGDVTLLTELAFIRYVCLGYGKDAYGNKNKLEVDPVPFSVLYRAFLIRLAKTPEMIRGSWFNKSDEMDRTCANALSDALHDVCENRVRVLGPAPAVREAPVNPNRNHHDDEAEGAWDVWPISKAPPLPPRSRVDHALDDAADDDDDARTQFAPKHRRNRLSVVSQQAFSTVTPNDSASQINSLGIRHQRLQRTAQHHQQSAFGGVAGAGRAATEPSRLGKSSMSVVTGGIQPTHTVVEGDVDSDAHGTADGMPKKEVPMGSDDAAVVAAEVMVKEKEPRVISFTVEEKDKQKQKQKEAVVKPPSSPTSTVMSRATAVTTATAATDAHTHMM